MGMTAEIVPTLTSGDRVRVYIGYANHKATSFLGTIVGESDNGQSWQVIKDGTGLPRTIHKSFCQPTDVPAPEQKPQPKSLKRQFLVELDVPPGATIADCVTYIHDAVIIHCGSLPPSGFGEDGDPMSELDRSSVKVRKHLPR
jgi:hypothetical protein